MQAILGASAELADYYRFVVWDLPAHLGRIVHVAVPADVLVETYHVHIFVHVVVQAVDVVGGTGHLHSHGDEAGGIEGAGVFGQIAQEGVALIGVWSLVGDAPNNDVGAVVVAAYHVGELLLGIVVCAGVGPGDGPVARDFAPYHYAHPFGLAYHVLIVRVVGQADKVAAQFLRPGEQRARVLHGVRAAAAVGLLLVYGYAFQEDRLIVQQYLLAAGLDGAETDFIRDSA